MAAWLFPRLDAARGSAGAYSGGPYRVVMHTTEVTADPRNWVPGWVYPSHIVADPVRKVIVQCLPLNEAAKALWNEPGGSETNRQCAIQIEVNGTSAEAPNMPADQLEWLGREVLAPVARWCAEQGSPIDLTDVPQPGAIPNSARVDAPQRMTLERWDAFAGVCGHRHVPENDHWDAGALNTAAIAAAATAALGGTPPAITGPYVYKDEEMVRQFRDVSTGTIWAVAGLFKTPLNDDGLRRAMVELGIMAADIVDVNAWTLAELVEVSPEASASSAQTLAALLARPSATGSVDAAALASQIVGAMGPDVAKAVVTELSARLAS